MSLQPGRRLAHYEILALIGQGGMGEVYRARDGKLGRDVAIKVLPRELAGNTERLTRFQREARVLASLNHPSIASIHGLEESEGTHYLVLELVEGATLAERISRGPIPVDEAREIAREIAQALEEAHERGIVHRDLKPANVKLTRDGKVKVLDFGLAKTFAEGSAEGDNSESPTLANDATREGVILGTAAYMSPEQARGQEVDARSDLWAFGCVLWECLAGRKAFGGATLSDSIGAILHTEPDWTRLPADTPASVRRLLRRCLAKSADERLHHIADARIELEEPEPLAPVAASPWGGRRVVLGVVALALAGALGAGLSALWRPAADSSDSGERNPLAGARSTRVTDFEGSEFDAAISPDGRFVAFISDRDGPFEVFVGQLDTGEFRSLTQGRDDTAPGDVRAPVRGVGFSGDGSEVWLGGGPARPLRVLPLLGGPVRPLLGEHVINVAWSPDGERVVYHESHPGDPVYVADRNGTNARLVLGGSADGLHQHYSTWSVDGQWIYLVRGRPATLEMGLWRVRPDGGDLERLTRRKLDDTGVSRRASVGLEQYTSISASADRRRLVGTVQNPQAALWSVPILDRVATEADAEALPGLPPARALAPRFGGSSLFYLSSRGTGDGLWRLRDGRVAEIWRGSETALLEPAAVSPDGEAVVLLLRREDGWRLHVLSADGAQLRVLSETLDARGAASWSPDGRWIVTGGIEDGAPGLFRIPVEGGAAVRIADGDAVNPVWSPDGTLFVYAGPQVNAVLPLLGVNPDGNPVELPKIEFLRFGERMRFLPDGSGLVYMQGLQPSQDFWLLDLAIMKSRQLARLDPTTTMRSFDVTPDGRRIVFDRLTEASDIVLIERGE